MAVIPLIIQPAKVENLEGDEINIVLPENCVGIFLAFDTEEHALKYHGKDAIGVDFVEIQIKRK